MSGKNIIKMDFLKSLYQQLYNNVVTYIQSGNVAFDTEDDDATKIINDIETTIRNNTGLDIKTVLITQEELREIISNNPFHNHIDEGTKKLYVFLLNKKAPENALDLIKGYLIEGEQVSIHNNEIYFITSGYGNSKFNNNLVDRKLGVVSTTRNWATINKASEL